MPFAFIIVGLVMVISGVRGTSSYLLTLVKGDITGKNGYLYWMVTILAVGAVGYIPSFKSVSRAFLTLILVVLVLKDGTGFFSKFTIALQQISQPNTVQGTSVNAGTQGINAVVTSTAATAL